PVVPGQGLSARTMYSNRAPAAGLDPSVPVGEPRPFWKQFHVGDVPPLVIGLLRKTSYVRAAVPPASDGAPHQNEVLLVQPIPVPSLGAFHSVLSASLQSQGTAWLSRSASVLFVLLTPGHLSALGSLPMGTSGSRSQSRSGQYWMVPAVAIWKYPRHV